MDSSNQRNTKQAQPKTGFEAFNGMICYAVKHMERLKAEGMSEYGLSGTHTLCMRQLFQASEGLTRTELAQSCGVDRAQITRVIGELLAKGFVEERGGASNYRKKCALTEKGKEVTADINDRVERIIRFVSGSIPPERLAIFYETLGEICDNLEKAEQYL